MVRKPVLPTTNNRPPAKPGIAGSILRQRCPRCREGAIYRGSLFRGWLSMYERCPVCNLKFEREQGYFVGAMYVSYMLAIPPYLLLVTSLWLFAGWRYEFALLGAVVACLPFVSRA